jgi:hypothetical protein
MVETNKGTRQEFVVFCRLVLFCHERGCSASQQLCVLAKLPRRIGEALIPSTLPVIRLFGVETCKHIVSGYIQKAVDLKQRRPQVSGTVKTFFADCLVIT